MNYTIKLYPTFKKQFKHLFKRYKSLETDTDLLVESLLKDPYQGADLGRDLRKVCMAISAKGKSGGARVITLILAYSEEESEIGLLYIYDKSERETLSDAELTELLRRNEIL